MQHKSERDISGLEVGEARKESRGFCSNVGGRVGGPSKGAKLGEHKEQTILEAAVQVGLPVGYAAEKVVAVFVDGCATRTGGG